MMLRGAGILLLIVWSVCAGVMACDNIDRPVTEPFLQGSAETPVDLETTKPKDLTRDNLEAYYNFIVENRTILNDVTMNLINLRDSDTAEFTTQRNIFRSRVIDLERRLEMQRDSMNLTRVIFPDDHPARQLYFAAELLDQETDHYMRVLYENKPLDPKIDQQLQEKLNLSRKLLDNFQDEGVEPEGIKPKPE